MSGAAPARPEPPQQLWLEVARPIQPRPRRAPLARSRATPPGDPAPSPQMELRMAPPRPARAIVPSVASPVALPPSPPSPVLDPPIARPCFVAWLLGQAKRGGAIGELAKAARIDPRLPKDGSADDLRARFCAAGADGDAFAALDDAERDYDRGA